MIVLGIVLLVLGYLLGVGLLVTLGWVLLVVGLVLLLMGSPLMNQPVGGRRHWW